MSAALLQPRLNQDHFEHIRKMLYRVSRIDLKTGKESLVEARLGKRLRTLGLDSFDAYIHRISQDRSGNELAFMVDALTTNKTSFFREYQHFELLHQQVLPYLKEKSKKIRIWCAGCSSGEEPYSLGISMREEWPDVDRLDVRILATDISDTALEKARQALYDEDQLGEVPPRLRQKYFAPAQPRSYQVAGPVKDLVQFAALNLMGPWPMRGPFDVIFCRNVMIYFDRPTQEQLVQRFYSLLLPGGYFFISHSESLSGVKHSFNYVQPAVYRR